MADKLEVTVEIIAHATEDVEKILDSFFELFNIPKDEFSRQNLTGHFDNPITLLRAKIKKKDAKSFLEKLIQEEKDAIKFKIVTPAYNKKDTVKNYVTLLTGKSK